MAEVSRLYPAPPATVALEGLYLGENLREGAPLVYTNFIASLDGRIAAPDAHGRSRVPPAIANPHDWRLYMELLAQADAVFTTGRHLRAVAAGRHADLLTLTEEHRDLIDWRRRRTLPRHPDCVAVSRSLDLPAAALCGCHPGRVLIITNTNAPEERAEALMKAGIDVLRVSAPGIDGRAIVQALRARGYGHIYSIAGPRVLYTLLEANVLDSLYFTFAFRALGGERFDTLLRGRPFDSPRGFTLRSLYHDPSVPAGAGQLFMCLARTPA